MHRASLLVLFFALASAPAQIRADEPYPARVYPSDDALQRLGHAARRTQPIVLDGKANDPGWAGAEWTSDFTQNQPDEGAKPSAQTRFKMVWDEAFLYIAFECDDPEAPTASLSRRDRYVEGDWISIDLDTTLDRRTAYHFQVFAGGHQLDALHFNDTDQTNDWDAAWESAVAIIPTGWSVEMKIPLRVLRIPDKATRFGVNVFRGLSRLHERDEWKFQPHGRPGNISREAFFDGFDGIKPVRELELRPYLGMRASRFTPAPGPIPANEYGLCSSVGVSPQWLVGLCGGIDFRYNVASDLSLVGTINPDFGQVEADQRVLNLTTFETFFPEKRPFFLEGLDLFKAPVHVDFGGPYGNDAYQIFYSRRIGRGAPTASDIGINTNQLVYEQQAVPVIGAAKMSGTIGATSVGVLAAFEPRLDAQILGPDGKVEVDRTIEARATAAARLRTPIGDNALVGITATAVDPIETNSSLYLDGTHAHVGSADVTLFNKDRSWNFSTLVSGSLLTGHIPQTLLDGTRVDPTSSGWAVSSRLSHETEHTVFAVNGDRLSPTFNVDQLGYLQRANLTRLMGYFALRDPHQSSIWQNAQLLFGAREIRDAAFALRLERDALLEVNVLTNPYWFFQLGSLAQTNFVDDRELEDGTPIERRGNLSAYGYISTDSRKRVQLQFAFTEGRAYSNFERTNQLEWTGVFRPLPQLDASLDISYNEQAGVFRAIRTATALPGPGVDPTLELDRPTAVNQQRLYLLAQQQARSVSALFRATYAFTPYLTLQGYAQLFTAGVSYGQPYQVIAQPGKSTIGLNQLTPASAATMPPNPDDRQAGLNVQVVLRWEWRVGSTLYLVYAHQTSNDIAPPLDHGLNFRGEFGALTSQGAARGDTLLVKIDLLSAL